MATATPAVGPQAARRPAPAQQRSNLSSAGPRLPARRPAVATRVAKKGSDRSEDIPGLNSQDILNNLDARLDEYLPDRKPGEFPECGVHPDGWMGASTIEDEPAFDPLRDGPLRYLGYANELGEAFAAFLPPAGVPLSYAVAIAYVLADTYDKGVNAKHDSEDQLQRKSSMIPEEVNKDRLSTAVAAERALDTVVWQLLASVAIPGFTIHQVVAVTHNLLHPHLQHLSNFEVQEVAEAASALHVATNVVIAGIDKAVPTAMGLLTIPFIVHAIDHGVHVLLDKTLRPAMKKVICEDMQGDDAGMDVCADPFEGM